MARRNYEAELVSTWDSGEAFLRHYVATDPDCPGHFLWPQPPGEERPKQSEVDDLVVVVLRFKDPILDFHVRARVVGSWRRDGERGLEVEFLPSEDVRERLLLAVARGGEVPMFRRYYERIPCDLEVILAPPSGAAIHARTMDISEGGLKLRMATEDVEGRALTVEATMRLTVRLPGNKKKVVVDARVVHIQRAGSTTTMGLRFVFASVEQQYEIGKQVGLLRLSR
ncbi:MAG: PilZ domain-containing protein [Deltaproteobacteria bacterium]|nr:PilZ domain-containing protein [Deltaproteobacteria bacterium]